MTSRILRTPDDLIAAGLAPAAARPALDALAERYAIAIPSGLAARITAPDDPLGRQFVPDPAELETAPEERQDPIGDEALSPIKGIVHRYPDRVLLKPLLVCPVYCRFCFRREQVGPKGGLLSEAELEAACAWIAARPQIREVILSGGEPLALAPRRLGALLRRLAALPAIEILRIHTRLPVALPERVDERLLAALAVDKPLFLVLHANHPREFGPETEAALRRLAGAGIPLLGQSVLLRGVNDDAATLAELWRTMLRNRVKPYYLHALDRAPGTARFEVPIAEGRALLESLRGKISGLAWPTFVLDIPGGYGKVPVGPDYWEAVRGLDGRRHPLPLAPREETREETGAAAAALAEPEPSV
jgi:lysine 2,3-aminomutase